MVRTAKIAVSASTYAIDRPYDYLIPGQLAEAVHPGMRAAVPFGRGNRVSDGIVLALGEREDGEKLKSILALLDEEPLLDEGAIQLALWMREQYFCTVYDAMRAMIPAGLWFSLKNCWRIAPGVDRETAFEAAGESKRAQQLVELLFANGGWAEEGKIRTAFGVSDPGPAIRALEQGGIIVQEASAARGVNDKTEQIAALVMDPGSAMALLAAKRRRAPLQYAAGETICAVGETSAKELCYFTGASMATLRALERMGVLTLSRREVYRRPQLPVQEEAAPVELSEEQNIAYEELLALLDQGSAAALLYGVTGSGKTQVYLKLIHTLLERGKTALVMVPEIALTPQLMRIFTSQFGRKVAILHSSLSAGERCDEWKRARAGVARVVVGTRSAVFAPLPDLGVIILDEEQEPSYKSEQNPRYHAREVARYRCYKAGALLLLGSATPSVESMYRAKREEYRLLELSQRFNQRVLPQVTVVDMKDELRRGNGGTISAPLAEMLEETIDRGEQAILFLNRRGANRMVTCGECGETPACPRCSVHLTYHSANRRLMCHYCGWSSPCRTSARPVEECWILWARAPKRWRRSFARSSPERLCCAWTRIRFPPSTVTRAFWKSSERSAFPFYWAHKWWQRGWILKMSPWWAPCRRTSCFTPATSTQRSGRFLCSPRWWEERAAGRKQAARSSRPLRRTTTWSALPPVRITTAFMNRRSGCGRLEGCRRSATCSW